MTFNARMLITALFLMGITPLWAQNQRLTWVGDEYTMRYEVIIEQEEEVKYKNVLKEFTENFFIEISLPTGKYRCQVIPYDFLNQPVPVTEWMEFEVISGNHETIMVNEIPLTASTLNAAEPEKIIAYKNRFNIYLSAAWISIAPFYQRSEKEFDESEFFGEDGDISPYGIGLRLGIASAKQRLLNPGVELTALWCISTILFDCDMIQQFFFAYGRVSLNCRLGAGIALVSSDNSRWASGQQYATHFNVGVSLLFLLPQNLFTEMGIEYSQCFRRDFFCYPRSWIGIGYRF